MAFRTLNHDEHDCAAYQYCKALEAFGLSIPLGKTCLFDLENSEIHLHDVVAARIDSLDTPDLARALIDAARLELESFFQCDLIEPVASLTKTFDAEFEAHMLLWKAMIDACRAGRLFTDVELKRYESQIEAAASLLQREIDASDRQSALCAQASHDRKLMNDYDLLFDDTMIADINRLVGNIVNARPSLLVGDKGIAKTQVAEFVMGLYESEPIVVSVKGDMMSDELVGKLKHDRELNTFVFEEGVVLRAMREGKPVLLDEMNFGDQSIIVRLQDILLKKPGETVFVQENGEHITVAPGFAIIATANEASVRYRHREILDPAIRDRFDIIMRTYPDLDAKPLIDISGKLLRLALSVASDPWGFPSKHIDLMTLVSFVRLAHTTELLYAIPGKNFTVDLSEGKARGAATEDSEPLMTDCITPRTVAKTVRDCARGNLPGEELDIPLIERLLKSLDQANSLSNYELAAQVASLMDIELMASESKKGISPLENTSRSTHPYGRLQPGAIKALLSR